MFFFPSLTVNRYGSVPRGSLIAFCFGCMSCCWNSCGKLRRDAFLSEWAPALLDPVTVCVTQYVMLTPQSVLRHAVTQWIIQTKTEACSASGSVLTPLAHMVLLQDTVKKHLCWNKEEGPTMAWHYRGRGWLCLQSVLALMPQSWANDRQFPTPPIPGVPPGRW